MRFFRRPVPAAIVLTALSSLAAADWPEWRGRGRQGIWSESGIVERFPRPLAARWRTPVYAGYSSPSVAKGQVFVTDFRQTEETRGVERALALDERTGRVLWTREWPVDYRGMDYAHGPRAAPTADDDRVYTLGATGILHCLETGTGRVIWKRDFVKDFGAQLPAWGFSSAPLIDGNRVIAVAAGRPDAKVMAFDKATGKEIWRALSSEESEPGYSQPTLIEAGGKRQLIVWHAGGLASLDPASGMVYWEQSFPVLMNTPIATPVHAPPFLLVSSFFNGARLYRLDGGLPQAAEVWRGNSENEINSDTLHALMASPVIDGDYIYGFCSFGQLRCLKLKTGERVWESQEVNVEKLRNASAFLIRLHDRYVIFNDRGELILARLSPQGYEEIDRMDLIEPTSPYSRRRERGGVAWAHPAFANRHVYARNDREILAVSLAADVEETTH